MLSGLIERHNGYLKIKNPIYRHVFNSEWGVAFSPDGQTIVSASLDKTMKLWNIDGTELRTLRGHSASI
ncbi:WD40 repeat domain-containing protein [Fortiea contorta]|uniref:WD40 repeat domain-containing protein n=1 Tax=Fortiea contorta TaxID=1892405 RepID=UPI00034A58D3|nr:hypothetical protein [Fortiea contorta]